MWVGAKGPNTLVVQILYQNLDCDSIGLRANAIKSVLNVDWPLANQLVAQILGFRPRILG